MHVKPISENVECVYESTNYIDLEINLYLSINLLYRSINLRLYMCVQYLKKGFLFVSSVTNRFNVNKSCWWQQA